MYKVFINDQVILFERPDSDEKSSISSRGEFKSVEKLYQSFSKNQFTKNKFIRFQSLTPFKDFKRFVHHFEIIKAAGGVVTQRKSPDSILMIFRLGKWDLPKGKIDGKEGVKVAAIREVEEECGIKKLSVKKRLKHTYHLYQIGKKWVVKDTSWFLMENSDPSKLVPQKEEGIEKAAWIKIKDIPNYLPLSYNSIAELLKSEILSR